MNLTNKKMPAYNNTGLKKIAAYVVHSIPQYCGMLLFGPDNYRNAMPSVSASNPPLCRTKNRYGQVLKKTT